MSTDRALAIAAIRHFLPSRIVKIPDRLFFIRFRAELAAQCRLVSPFWAISSTSNDYLVAPSPTVGLRHDWRTAVHDRDLDMLPPSPMSKSVFILHAEEDYTHRGVTTAKAVWTMGRTLIRGWIAWRRDEFEPNIVVAWAISTTETRAIKKLASWPEALRVPTDDADALAEIVL